jgi:peptidoglycan L-alanyl-D-glutamate endopeptidase CwlK
MPGPFKFGKASMVQYVTLDKRMQKVLDEVIKMYDFQIVEGFRGQIAQDWAYKNKKSQVRWPNGKHNKLPSKAVDIYPYPVDWSDDPKNIQRSVLLAGMVLATGFRLGIPLRWGGDWNSDGDTRDENFRDYGHFEIDE